MAKRAAQTSATAHSERTTFGTSARPQPGVRDGCTGGDDAAPARRQMRTDQGLCQNVEKVAIALFHFAVSSTDYLRCGASSHQGHQPIVHRLQLDKSSLPVEHLRGITVGWFSAGCAALDETAYRLLFAVEQHDLMKNAVQLSCQRRRLLDEGEAGQQLGNHNVVSIAEVGSGSSQSDGTGKKTGLMGMVAPAADQLTYYINVEVERKRMLLHVHACQRRFAASRRPVQQDQLWHRFSVEAAATDAAKRPHFKIWMPQPAATERSVGRDGDSHASEPQAMTAAREYGLPAAGRMRSMTGISLSVPAYDASIGVVAPAEGGTITVMVVDGAVEIFGDPAGLRDLARMCLALSDVQAPEGVHIHLDAGTSPLDLDSASLMLARDQRCAA
jgi:hypothetical protein